MYKQMRPGIGLGGMCLAMALVLSGCGGGGNDTSGTGTGGTEAVTLRIPAPISSPPPEATEDVAADALAWTNYARAKAGLPAIARQAQLDKAAAAHASYIAQNDSYQTEGHDETQGKPGFTGTTPVNRIRAAGFPDSWWGENIAARTPEAAGSLFTDFLVDAPYHRSAQLSTHTQAGVATQDWTGAAGAGKVYVIDFGGTDPAAAQANVLWAYPYSGQPDAYLDWIAAETPNPVPDLENQRVGYPVTLHAALGQQLDVNSFSLADSRGMPVPVRQVTTHSGAPLNHYAIWIPLSPLVPGTTYTAQAAGKLNGKSFQVQWSFTTLPDAPLGATASATAFATPGSTVTFKMEGGTGRYTLKYSWRYFNSSASQIGFSSFTRQASNQWVATRNTVACPAGVTPCGDLTATFSDTAGHQVSITLPMQ